MKTTKKYEFITIQKQNKPEFLEIEEFFKKTLSTPIIFLDKIIDRDRQLEKPFSDIFKLFNYNLCIKENETEYKNIWQVDYKFINNFVDPNNKTYGKIYVNFNLLDVEILNKIYDYLELNQTNRYEEDFTCFNPSNKIELTTFINVASKNFNNFKKPFFQKIKNKYEDFYEYDEKTNTGQHIRVIKEKFKKMSLQNIKTIIRKNKINSIFS